MSRFREEIGEQPHIAERLVSSPSAAAAGERIRAAGRPGIVIAARGSSDNAALYAKYLFGARNRILVSLAAPSLFTRYSAPPRLDGQCVIGVSQSGESPDVVAVLEEGRRQGALTVAITNNPASQLATSAELVIPLGLSREESVPASKTYTASLIVLALISQAIDAEVEFGSALAALPQRIAAVIDHESDVAALAPRLGGTRAVVLGRGFNFSTAEEVALKLCETSYVLARAWAVSDFEHGPIAIVESGLPVILLDGGGLVADDVASLHERLSAMGSDVIELVDRSLPESLTPITLAVKGQLLAHHVATARGIDPDRPRTIRKVTRTW